MPSPSQGSSPKLNHSNITSSSGTFNNQCAINFSQVHDNVYECRVINTVTGCKCWTCVQLYCRHGPKQRICFKTGPDASTTSLVLNHNDLAQCAFSAVPTSI